MIKKKPISCPNCGKQNTWQPENVFRPFCSERCKLIDLGQWANESYRVAGEKAPVDENNKQKDDEK